MELTLTITGLSPAQLEEVGQYAASITNADTVLGPIEDRMTATADSAAVNSTPVPIIPLGEPTHPAPPPAPAASVATVGTRATDSNGMPWDARIHAATAAVNKDGSWKYRRSTDKNPITKEQITAIEAELSGGAAIGTEHITPEVTEPAPVDPAAILGSPVPEMEIPPGLVRTPDPIVAATIPDVAPPPPPVDTPPVAGDPAAEYANMMVVLSSAIAAQTMTTADITVMNANFNITNIAEIQGDSAKIAQALMWINTIVATKASA
jgi:hypothetical protein